MERKTPNLFIYLFGEQPPPPYTVVCSQYQSRNYLRYHSDCSPTLIPYLMQWFVIRRLGLAVINRFNKFEVFIFAHSEDWQADVKNENGVVHMQ